MTVQCHVLFMGSSTYNFMPLRTTNVLIYKTLELKRGLIYLSQLEILDSKDESFLIKSAFRYQGYVPTVWSEYGHLCLRTDQHDDSRL